MGRLSSLRLIGVILWASAAYYLSTEQGKKVTKSGAPRKKIIKKILKKYMNRLNKLIRMFQDKQKWSNKPKKSWFWELQVLF